MKAIDIRFTICSALDVLGFLGDLGFLAPGLLSRANIFSTCAIGESSDSTPHTLP